MLILELWKGDRSANYPLPVGLRHASLLLGCHLLLLRAVLTSFHLLKVPGVRKMTETVSN